MRACLLLGGAVSLHIWGVHSPNPQEPAIAVWASRMMSEIVAHPPIPLAPAMMFFSGPRTPTGSVQVVTTEIKVPDLPPVPADTRYALSQPLAAPVPVGTSGVLPAADAELAPEPSRLVAVSSTEETHPAPAGLSTAESEARALQMVVAELPLLATPAAESTGSSSRVTSPAGSEDVVVREGMRNREELILAVLGEYTRAFEQLDVRATKAVYPSIDGRQLQRAFRDLQAQQVRFASCNMSFSSSGDGASARCKGDYTARQKVGSRVVRLTNQEWNFSLARDGGEWQILKASMQKAGMQ